ncbi:unnamed protein product [Ilex paraguariensis]|uniref:Exostosin GT47 domain-containing protein n=1 Tax=Ilex paraguariensis TaxID=185542 RepID=A0ABC8RLT9_9AQUA
MIPPFGHSSPDLQTLKKSKSTLVCKKTFSPGQAYFFVHHRAWLFVTSLFLVFLLIFVTDTPHIYNKSTRLQLFPAPHAEKCESGKVYVYNLPEMFNREFLNKCHELDPWHSRCNALSNNGFGPRATGLAGIVPENLAPAWYWTDMFAGEIIYHNRMLNYKCRTMEPESAAAFYVPFYAGIAVGKYLFTNSSAMERDWHCEMLTRWVQNQQYWKRSNGSDHFIMFGRATWDFRRTNDADWGSSFINKPFMQNITRLTIERSQWDPLDVSVPYPTGFHPRSDADIRQWLNFVRTRKRKSLFTFVGGKRSIKNDFRSLLLSYCYNESDSCRVVDCARTRCQDGTSAIIEAFLDSDFCLQPRGDAYTRRSQFDCMLAGSIPVFFWKRSVYDQYQWFFPSDPASFSVFIDRKDVRNGAISIRRVLESFSREDVRRIREKVFESIPKFLYANPSQGLEISTDAFDIAINGVLRRIKEQRGGRKSNTTKEANERETSWAQYQVDELTVKNLQMY